MGSARWPVVIKENVRPARSACPLPAALAIVPARKGIDPEKTDLVTVFTFTRVALLLNYDS